MNSMMKDSLAGTTLFGDWTIEKALSRPVDATGSQFSAGFIATNKDGSSAFVKALDPSVDQHLEAIEQLKDLQARLEIFNYECELLEKCVLKKIRRVVRIIDRGTCVHEKYSTPIHYPRVSG